MALQLSLGAEEDAAEAIDWYESQREGLGEEFRATLQGMLTRIDSVPFQFPKVQGANRKRHIRHGVMRKFPYRVVFEVRNEGDLLILAVAHTSRNPHYWKRRSI